MYRAILIKELREAGWIGLLAGGALLLFALGEMGLTVDDRPPYLYWRTSVYPDWVHPVPFGSEDWPLMLLVLGAAAGTVLGLWQTLGEAWQGTWVFYLHRPAARELLLLAKAAVGLGWLLACLGAPLLMYAVWAALPGTHASPFEWWMTGPTLRAWAFASVIYLAAFLCGLRPALWWGSRLFPLAAVALLWLPIVIVPWRGLAMWPVILTADLLLLSAIVYSGTERDYA